MLGQFQNRRSRSKKEGRELHRGSQNAALQQLENSIADTLLPPERVDDKLDSYEEVGGFYFFAIRLSEDAFPRTPKRIVLHHLDSNWMLLLTRSLRLILLYAHMNLSP